MGPGPVDTWATAQPTTASSTGERSRRNPAAMRADTRLVRWAMSSSGLDHAAPGPESSGFSRVGPPRGRYLAHDLAAVE